MVKVQHVINIENLEDDGFSLVSAHLLCIFDTLSSPCLNMKSVFTQEI
jgi:hypothetical protein